MCREIPLGRRGEPASLRLVIARPGKPRLYRAVLGASVWRNIIERFPSPSRRVCSAGAIVAGSSGSMSTESITVRGARVHNLKNIDVAIPVPLSARYGASRWAWAVGNQLSVLISEAIARRAETCASDARQRSKSIVPPVAISCAYTQSKAAHASRVRQRSLDKGHLHWNVSIEQKTTSLDRPRHPLGERRCHHHHGRQRAADFQRLAGVCPQGRDVLLLSL